MVNVSGDKAAVGTGSAGKKSNADKGVKSDAGVFNEVMSKLAGAKTGGVAKPAAEKISTTEIIPVGSSAKGNASDALPLITNIIDNPANVMLKYVGHIDPTPPDNPPPSIINPPQPPQPPHIIFPTYINLTDDIDITGKIAMLKRNIHAIFPDIPTGGTTKGLIDPGGHGVTRPRPNPGPGGTKPDPRYEIISGLAANLANKATFAVPYEGGGSNSVKITADKLDDSEKTAIINYTKFVVTGSW